MAGNQKATAEFVTLLNNVYNSRPPINGRSSTTQPAASLPPIETYFIGATVAIIIAITATVAILRKRR
jgi:hypothetical protein